MESISSPLKKYQRQPKLYIDLPSQGIWYDKNLVTKFKDLEVYSMTASDEISIKTPDALFSGNTVKTIIESCIPSIKDAWTVCNVDLDYILAAIRLASYGESISLSKKCEVCSNEDTYSYPVQSMLQHLENAEPAWELIIDDFKFRLRPLSYKEITENNQTNMTISKSLRKIITSLSEDDPEQEIQIEKLYEVLNEKVKDVVCNSIIDVTTPDGSVENNPTFIRNFVLNDADPKFFKQLQELFNRNSALFKIPEVDVSCSECDAKSSILPELDYTNFFSN